MRLVFLQLKTTYRPSAISEDTIVGQLTELCECFELRQIKKLARCPAYIKYVTYVYKIIIDVLLLFLCFVFVFPVSVIFFLLTFASVQYCFLVINWKT